jgi:hypothetical protein
MTSDEQQQRLKWQQYVRRGEVVAMATAAERTIQVRLKHVSGARKVPWNSAKFSLRHFTIQVCLGVTLLRLTTNVSPMRFRAPNFPASTSFSLVPAIPNMNLVTRGKRAVAGMAFAAALAIPTAAFADCVRTTHVTTYTVFGYVVYQTTEVTVTCTPD